MKCLLGCFIIIVCDFSFVFSNIWFFSVNMSGLTLPEMVDLLLKDDILYGLFVRRVLADVSHIVRNCPVRIKRGGRDEAD